MADFIALGLVGYPLSYSHSPAIHRAALAELGLDGDYELYPIPRDPHETMALENILDRVRSGELQGLNVTVPHKQIVMPYLDRLTTTAAIIGAVNTIFLENGQLVGDNTDAHGFTVDLAEFRGEAGTDGGKALILGAGGSARAVAHALLENGWRLTLAARRLEQALAIAESFGARASFTETRITPLPLDERELRFVPCDLLVNTTPVGMHPDVSRSPWPDGLPFPHGAAVYDLVYNPVETQLVRKARQTGHPAVTGLGMLVEQAALAFERWTGREAPRQVMRRAAESR